MQTRTLGFAATAAIVFAFTLTPVACQDDTGSSDGGKSSTNNTGASGAQGGAGGTGGGNTGGTGGTGGIGQQETICDDSMDNDGDGFVDCDDFDCEGTAACPGLTENTNALCTDGQDNDEDGLTDCADDSCHGHPDVTACQEQYADCDDGMDNDMDGFIDCQDRDCLRAAEANNAPGAQGVCWNDPEDDVEAGDVECGDDADNTDPANSFTDCADFSCQDSVEACSENTTAECTNDPVDENDNGFIDCNDFSCQEEGLCPETTDAECSDGISNNDGDNFVDCMDFSCQRSKVVTVCEGNARTCSDGINNDGNGFTDCEDFACRCCPGEGDACSTKYAASTCAPCAP